MKAKCSSPSKIIQAIKKVTGKIQTFFLVKILVINVWFRSSQKEMFYENKCSAKTCFGMQFFCTYGQKPWKISVKEFIFSKVAGVERQRQNSYIAEHLQIIISLSVTFLLFFRSGYFLEHFSVTALVYICSRIFRPFCNFF